MITKMAAIFSRRLLWRPAFSCFNLKFYSVPSSEFQRIGFIGLGNMGSHMATNLMNAGYELVVHDKNEEVVNLYSKRGAILAKMPYEVAEASDAVITMLPSAVAVSEVYLGQNGLLSNRNSVRPSLLIDASTVDPQTCRKIVSTVKQCSLSERSRRIGSLNHPVMLDSPVSGGVLGAQAGTLTFMVGGIEDGCRAARPLFDAMGKHVVYCGDSGNGLAAKICNNLALAVSMAGISEALALGQKLGIDAKTLSRIFNSSSARCWSCDTYNPVPGVMEGVPASRDYTGGFSCQLMKKDLGLAVSAAEDTRALAPLAQQVFHMYSKLCREGKEGKDFSSIFGFMYLGAPENMEPPYERKVDSE